MNSLNIFRGDITVIRSRELLYLQRLNCMHGKCVKIENNQNDVLCANDNSREFGGRARGAQNFAERSVKLIMKQITCRRSFWP